MKRIIYLMEVEVAQLQAYVDKHEDSENDDVLERVDTYQTAIEALQEAIKALQAVSDL